MTAAINTSRSRAQTIAEALISLGVGFNYSLTGESHGLHAHRIEVDPSRAELLHTCHTLAAEREKR